jgi:murein DD-endopeptidase MepM/ murein hydrolase activator NlpD
VTLRVFPVELEAKPQFTDTFGAPRPDGGKVHEGADIFAPEGSRVLAVDAGKLEHQQGPIGGNVAVLHTDDRTRYVYSHLSAYEGAPRRVTAGEVIGRVGHTGNAAKTPPHLHFEIHPLEGGAINPTAALKAAKNPPTTPVDTEPSSSAASSGALVAGDGLVLLLLLWLWSKKGTKGIAWEL